MSAETTAGLRERIAEALAERFTSPGRLDQPTAERFDADMMVTFAAPDGGTALRPVTPNDVAAALLPVVEAAMAGQATRLADDRHKWTNTDAIAILRRAVDKLRTAARNATPGPWTLRWVGQELQVDGPGKQRAECDTGNVQRIGAIHPNVGQRLADLLAQMADLLDASGTGGEPILRLARIIFGDPVVKDVMAEVAERDARIAEAHRLLAEARQQVEQIEANAAHNAALFHDVSTDRDRLAAEVDDRMAEARRLREQVERERAGTEAALEGWNAETDPLYPRIVQLEADRDRLRAAVSRALDLLGREQHAESSYTAQGIGILREAHDGTGEASC